LRRDSLPEDELRIHPEVKMYGYDRLMGYARGERDFGPRRRGRYGEGRGAGFEREGASSRGESGYPGEQWPPWGGWARKWGVERYDRALRGYDEPFLPESAYRRHPELDRPRSRSGGAWPDPGRARGGRAATMDEDLRQAVRESLYRDAWLQADSIRVEVENGIVTLRGDVDDYMEARYAWDDAWETPGVRGVVNQLTVRADRAEPEPAGEVLPQTAGGREGGPS
jgi:hypothetical protein